MDDYSTLKTALGISSRSLVHHWNKAGAPGQIPGYATHMDGVAKAAKYVKYGGWIGTAIGGGASYMKAQDVCTADDTEACQRVKFTETGSFIGSFAGGAAAGAEISTSVPTVHRNPSVRESTGVFLRAQTPVVAAVLTRSPLFFTTNVANRSFASTTPAKA